jgi:hypothetical protein
MKVVPDCDWFVVYAQGHHGYPQPENESWEALVYEAPCLRCGVHGPQKAGFRLRRSNRAPHSHFRQINWVFDAWFVQPEVEAALRAANLSGLAFRDAIDHKSGAPLEETRQLVVSTILDGADTTRLQPVTCRPNNEEGPPLAGPMRYPPNEPYCGVGKYHPPTRLVVREASLAAAPDVFLTSAWFGSGGGAHRLTLASRRFAELLHAHRWRGLELAPVSHDGYSERAV